MISILAGVSGCLLLGIGMCCTIVWMEYLFIPGVIIGYSDSNIREKTLLEAYRSPLFVEYHDNQPWNENLLRPCPVLDNPGRLSFGSARYGSRHERNEDKCGKRNGYLVKYFYKADAGE